MRITDIRVHPVAVPLTTTFASSLGSRNSTVRTVVRVFTDAGVVGLGEGLRGHPTADAINRLKPVLVGLNPLDIEALLDRVHMVPFFYGYVGYSALGAIEMACFDILGKTAGLPLYALLGGRYRDRIPATGLLTRGMTSPGQGTLSEQIVLAARSLVDAFGVNVLKFKGSHDPEEDGQVMIALRDALPDVRLRVDPNGAWRVHETVQVGQRLEACGLEWLEDPCWGLEAMAEARARVRIPFCTNMCVVRLEDVAPAVRLRAVDVVHGDAAKWGGILATKRLAACCEAFGLGMSMHSGGELGIGTACHLHLVASTPQVRHAIDSMYYLLADDVIRGPRFRFEQGAYALPDGPGLGVELDEEKLERYETLLRKEGDPAI